MNKKILTALGISLAINFIFIGFEAARIVYRPAFPALPRERPAFMPRGDRDAFEFRNKRVFSDAFRRAVKEHGKEMTDAKRAVEKAMKSDPFDAAAFKAASQKAADTRAAIDAAVTENIARMLADMDPDDRRAFAEKFSKCCPKAKKRGAKMPARHREAALPPPPAPMDADDEMLPPPPPPFAPAEMTADGERPVPPRARPDMKKPCPCMKKGKRPENPVPPQHRE